MHPGSSIFDGHSGVFFEISPTLVSTFFSHCIRAAYAFELVARFFIHATIRVILALVWYDRHPLSLLMVSLFISLFPWVVMKPACCSNRLPACNQRICLHLGIQICTEENHMKITIELILQYDNTSTLISTLKTRQHLKILQIAKHLL